MNFVGKQVSTFNKKLQASGFSEGVLWTCHKLFGNANLLATCSKESFQVAATPIEAQE